MKIQILIFAIGLYSLSSCNQKQNADDDSKVNPAASNEKKEAEQSNNSGKDPKPLVYYKKVMNEQINYEIIENNDSDLFTVIKFNDEKAGNRNGNIFELKLLSLKDGEYILGYHEFRKNGSTGGAPIFFQFDANGKETTDSGMFFEDLLTNKEEFSQFETKNNRSILQNSDCCAIYVFLQKKGSDLEVASLDSKFLGKLTERPAEYKKTGSIKLSDGKFTYVP